MFQDQRGTRSRHNYEHGFPDVCCRWSLRPGSAAEGVGIVLLSCQVPPDEQRSLLRWQARDVPVGARLDLGLGHDERHREQLGGLTKRVAGFQHAKVRFEHGALELAFERDYLTTFVIGTGDSDFTPLVHKLRELNRRVIGVGVKDSTSALLPPACDEFLFYERLEGVEVPARSRTGSERPHRRTSDQLEEPKVEIEAKGLEDLDKLVTQTLSGLQRTAQGAVLASSLKRALIRKDPTFSEADFGFRAFGELLRHMEQRKVVELNEGSAKGDPVVDFRSEDSGEDEAFSLLLSVVAGLETNDGPPALSGLKNQLRKQEPSFTEKRYGFGGFLQFCKAAQARGLIELEWSEDTDDYLVRVALPDR